MADETPLQQERSTRLDTVTTDEERLWLMVFGDELVASHPLPTSGEVILGRSERCDVPIDERSISRRHARLRIRGDELSIEDLGSANGTRVGGRPIEAHETVSIHHGEIVELGAASILVQRRRAKVRPRRLWPHGYFEGRLEDECGRAAAAHSTFAVAVIDCKGAPPAAAVQEALAVGLRDLDVAGEYGGGKFEMLLLDANAELAEAQTSVLLAELREREVDASVGIACFPNDGRTPDELIALAAARAGGTEVLSSGQRPLVVEDSAMAQLHRVLGRVASGNLSVLLLGETGVGKEVVAEMLHRRSPRADAPLVRINCAALTESLLESELFGHQKGAFTGADATKPGLLETAGGGTVFLDEIGELPMSTQVKLLRVLEDRLVMRVGGIEARPIDVRFVAATNRDPEAEIAAGRFRSDLYYRLAGITLVIPPLRERVGEIAPLARSFLDSIGEPGSVPYLSPEALEVLESYSWPGNVRELRNVVERAALLCSDGVIKPEHMPLEKMRATYTARPRTLSEPIDDADETDAVEPSWESIDEGETIDTSVDAAALDSLYPGDAERERIISALEVCGGNQTRAAKLLGMSRRTLINRIERYNLPRPRKGRK